MKCIVGLGNPGEKYQHNRHNVGFMVVDALLKMLQTAESSEHSLPQGSELSFAFVKKFNTEMVQTKKYILVKPMTYMNDSGRAVAKICHFYKIKSADLYVVHDDLDIILGEYKIQHAKGPRVHYGVNSVEKDLGHENFWRVRVGVENREVRGNRGVAGEVYSLQDFRDQEKLVIEGVIEQIVDELKAVVSL